MLTKFAPVARTLGTAARLQVVRCMGGHAPAHWKTDKQIAMEENAHMNNMPVPQGSWQENYNRRNSKWNVQLAISSVVLIATIYIMDQCEIFYLHSHPKIKK
ncbi:uncharacterized protein LOC143283660 [Babylonia areolata]|uniref:uncharacterized protein LOC143283660 n=1 Tax=Babylonia areolata TaxID=304850 RepID=UPI003FD10B1C